MVSIVSHQRGKIKGDRESSLPLRQEELVALVRFAGGPEPGELPHGPELATIPGGMNPAGEGPLSRQFERRASRILEIERGVQRRHVVRRIGEGDVALATRLILLSPLSNFTAQSVELFLLLADYILEILNGRHALIHPEAARIRRR